MKFHAAFLPLQRCVLFEHSALPEVTCPYYIIFFKSLTPGRLFRSVSDGKEQRGHGNKNKALDRIVGLSDFGGRVLDGIEAVG